MPSRKLMEGYVGVRFKAISVSGELPVGMKGQYPEFKSVCERLRESGMTDANAGNLSVRTAGGFIITSAGSNLGSLKHNELVFVSDCNIEREEVYYSGTEKPSSEAMMHYLIYKERPGIKAVIHAHDKLISGINITDTCPVSEKEYLYGSIELAKMAILTFRKSGNIIVLKNHGYVAVGIDLSAACDLVIKTHNHLLKNPFLKKS